MLLDRKHSPWAVATIAMGSVLVGLYLWLDGRTPGGLTGGSSVGLWYGIIATALMMYAGMLSVHRLLPAAWWMGNRQTWLRGHIWLGSLSVVLIACHAHGRLGGPLEVALWIVLFGIVATGIYGLILQQVLPRWLARRFPDEAPIGQIPHLCRVFRLEADELVDSLAPTGKSPEGPGTFVVELRKFHEELIRPFLNDPPPKGSPLVTSIKAQSLFSAMRARLGLRRTDPGDPAVVALSRLEELCRDRRHLAEQVRVHHWLHAWLLLHVPLSAALLILGIAHVVMTTFVY